MLDACGATFPKLAQPAMTIRIEKIAVAVIPLGIRDCNVPSDLNKSAHHLWQKPNAPIVRGAASKLVVQIGN